METEITIKEIDQCSYDLGWWRGLRIGIVSGIIISAILVSLTGCESPGFSETDLYGNTNIVLTSE